MKNKIIAITLIACLFINISAFAATVTLDDYINGIIKVDGEASGSGKNVNILVLNPGGTPELAESDSSLLQYQGEVTSDANKKYTKYIKLNIPEGADTGDFVVYLGGDDFSTPQRYVVYFATLEEKIAAAKAILASSVAELPTKLTENKRILALDIDTVNSINLAPLAQKLKASLNTSPIVFDDVNIESQANINALMDLQGRIKKISVIECYNQSKSTVVFGSGNTFRYDEITGFATMDSSRDITAYNLYVSCLNQQGKELVQAYLLNKNVEQVEDILRLFADAVMFYGIANNKEQGYGHISNYITLKNVMFADNVAESLISVPTYLSISDKSSVNLTITRNADQLNIENYKEKIEEYAKASVLQPSPNPTPNNNGPGGGGGSSFSVSPVSTQAPTPTPTAKPQNEFTDLDEAAWAKDAILYLTDKGIISGVGDNRYSPSENLTREQAAKIICLAFNIELNDEMPNFADVNPSDWYIKYVSAAQKLNIVKGINESEFGIGSNVTRQDLAVMIYRAINGQMSDDIKTFTDDSDISDYAKDAVNFLRQTGIVNGYEDGTFKPGNFITRAETAQIIYGILTKEGVIK